MAALKSRFTNFMYAVQLIRFTSVRIPRTLVLCAITAPSLARGTKTFLVYLHSLSSYSSTSLALLCLIVREKGIFFVLLPAHGNIGPSKPPPACPYLPLSLFMSSNGRIWKASPINREKAVHDKRLAVEHN